MVRRLHQLVSSSHGTRNVCLLTLYLSEFTDPPIIFEILQSRPHQQLARTSLGGYRYSSRRGLASAARSSSSSKATHPCFASFAEETSKESIELHRIASGLTLVLRKTYTLYASTTHYNDTNATASTTTPLAYTLVIIVAT